jgi:hypothetical protein
MKRRILLSMMILAATTGSLSGESLPGYILLAQTQHIAFFAAEGRKLGVKSEKAEKFLVEMARQLGVTFDEHIDYYRHKYPQEVAFHAGVLSTGAAIPRKKEVHSTLEYHPHEIVHLITARMGQPSPLFNEGLAIHLGDQGKFQGRPVDDFAKEALRHLPVDTLINEFDRLDTRISYPLAGSFVGYLCREYGLARVADFFRACKGRFDEEKAFTSVFGTRRAEMARRWSDSLGVKNRTATVQMAWLDSPFSLDALRTR